MGNEDMGLRPTPRWGQRPQTRINSLVYEDQA